MVSSEIPHVVRYYWKLSTTVINEQKNIKLERILRRRLRLNDIEREQHSTWAASGIK